VNLAVQQTIEALSCGECGVVYGLPSGFLNERRRDHKEWFCPNGHRRWFPPGKSETDVLKEKLAKEEQRSRWWAEHAESVAHERDRAKRQASAARGTVTKMKRRAAAGTCQCCHRSFANVARHMGTQHPGYVEQQRNGSRRLP
jgi:hypothetical protein